MKRLLVIVGAVFLSVASYGQIKVGLKASPNLSWNHIQFNSDSVQVNGNGIKLRIGGGVMLDFMFSDNYAFSTGVNYTTKGSGFKIAFADSVGFGDEFTQKMVLQYIELPTTFKLFTNEIMDYTKLYFQVGVTNNFNIAAKVNDKNSYEEVQDDGSTKTVPFTKNIKFYEASLLIAAGIEMEMGENTNFLAGLSYNRGLINIDATNTFENPNMLKNDYLSIDVGLKF